MRTKILVGVVAVILLVVGITYNLKSKQTAKQLEQGQNLSSQTTDLDRPLVVGLVSWPGYAGGIVANNGFEPNEESIFYKKYGLKVKLVLIEDIDARGKAFAKGGPDGVDVVWSTVDFFANEAPNFIASDVHPKAIMQVDWSRGGDALVASEQIKTVADLKGKKIALVQYTPSDWLFENILKNSNLTKDEQTEIRKNLVFSQDTTTARQAFVTGAVDAVVTWEPDVSQSLSKRPGSHVLNSSKGFSQVIADVMIAQEQFINNHPRALEAFTRGWLDGVTEAYANPDKTAKLLMDNEPLFADLGFEVTKNSLLWVKLADLDDNKVMFGLDGGEPLFDKLFIEASRTWVEKEYMSEAAKPAEVKDDRFLKAIYGG